MLNKTNLAQHLIKQTEFHCTAPRLRRYFIFSRKISNNLRKNKQQKVNIKFCIGSKTFKFHSSSFEVRR